MGRMSAKQEAFAARVLERLRMAIFEQGHAIERIQVIDAGMQIACYIKLPAVEDVERAQAEFWRRDGDAQRQAEAEAAS